MQPRPSAVYCRKQEFADALSELDRTQKAFHHRVVVVCAFRGEDVAHVYADPADGRVVGNPGYGLLVAVRLPKGVEISTLSQEERLRLVAGAIAELPVGDREFLVAITSRTSHADGITVMAFWYASATKKVQDVEVRFTPDATELFARSRGLVETSALANKTVTVVGLGSGGSACAVELAKAGVGAFYLLDFDRLEATNVARHVCGISALGRFKTRAVRDVILDKHPLARVDTHEIDVVAHPEILWKAIMASNVIIAGTDNNASRRIINQLALRARKVCFYGRAMIRACGGDVLRVRPSQGPCYECVLSALWQHTEEEVSRRDQLDVHEYADRPVVAAPGLANDIAPLSTMIVKLALQELVRGTGSGLESVESDLVADFYLWVNRREAHYKEWQPMGCRVNGLSVLRWFGIRMARNDACPACGQFRGDVEAEGEDERFFR